MLQNDKTHLHKNIIGVTGISGSGTSTVSAILAEHGGFVISADALARDVMKKGQPAYYNVLEAFPELCGTDVNGELNRKALSQIVFFNPQKLAVLESIIHPIVIAKTTELLDNDYPFSVIDAPLLIEPGMHKLCHSVWLVTATKETRIQRIMARDGIDTSAATRRIKCRKGDKFLRSYADIIIENNGSLENLRMSIEEILGSI